MAAVAAAAIAAGAGIVGDMMSQSGQQSANQMNMAMQLQNEQWQTQMSDTAMQRRVADYKAAGLNPMLAAGGSGATVGSVSNAQMMNPDAAFGNLGSQAATAVQAYQQQQLTDAQVQKANADTAVSNATAANVQQDTQNKTWMPLINSFQAGKIASDTMQSDAATENYKAQTQLLQSQIANVTADTAGKDLSNQQRSQLIPLVIQYQSLQNAAVSRGLKLSDNDAAAQDSWWSKNVAPYLPSVLQGAHSAQSLGAAGESAMGLLK